MEVSPRRESGQVGIEAAKEWKITARDAYSKQDIQDVQRSGEFDAPGFVNSVPAVSFLP